MHLDDFAWKILARLLTLLVRHFRRETHYMCTSGWTKSSSFFFSQCLCQLQKLQLFLIEIAVPEVVSWKRVKEELSGVFHRVLMRQTWPEVNVAFVSESNQCPTPNNFLLTCDFWVINLAIKWQPDIYFQFTNWFPQQNCPRHSSPPFFQMTDFQICIHWCLSLNQFDFGHLSCLR